MNTDDIRVNDEIRARRVTVVTADGVKLGEYLIGDALRMAEDEGLDLVEVSSDSEKSICKIMDFSKWAYQQKKRQKQNSSDTIQVKEIHLSAAIDEHDINVKVKKAREFLERGDKVKFFLKFKGRETAHIRLGFEKINSIYDKLKDVGTIESEPKMAGAAMLSMTLMKS